MTLELSQSFSCVAAQKYTWIIGFYKLVENPKPVWPDRIKYECMNNEGSLVLIVNESTGVIRWEFQYNNELVLYSFKPHGYVESCADLHPFKQSWCNQSCQRVEVKFERINPLELKIWQTSNDKNKFMKGRYEGSRMNTNKASKGLVMELCFDWGHFKNCNIKRDINNLKSKNKQNPNKMRIRGILEWRILNMPECGENWYWYSEKYMKGKRFLDIIILEYVDGFLDVNKNKINVKGYALIQPCSITYLDEYEIHLDNNGTSMDVKTIGEFAKYNYKLKRSATKCELEKVLEEVFEIVELGQVNIIFLVVVEMLYDPISIQHIMPKTGSISVK